MSVISKSRSWFSAKKSNADSAEIAIFDEIGVFGIRADAFRDELKGLGDVKEINLHINSPGGDVFDGLAIFNMLNRHKAQINVTIDGIAASMASVVAMAGDEIIMPENAMMMIHDPWGVVIGNADDMRDLAEAMDKIKSGMVSAYAAKAKIPRDGIIAMMSAETWLTAEEAIDAGFADKVEQPVKIAAKFDLTKFKNVPADVGVTARATAASHKEHEMTEAEKAAAAAAEQKAKDEAELKAKTEAETKAKAEADAKAKADAEAAAKANEYTVAMAQETVELCALAGFAAKAAEFVAAKTAVDKVRAALIAEKAKSGGKEISARHSDTGGGEGQYRAKQIERHNARFDTASR